MSWRALIEKVRTGAEVSPGVNVSKTGETSINQSEDFCGLQQPSLVNPVSAVYPAFRDTRISCFDKTTTFNMPKRQGYTSNDENNRHSLVSLPGNAGKTGLTGTTQFEGETPAEWGAGYERLLTMSLPAKVSPDRWQHLLKDTRIFLDRFGPQAAALGWTVLDLWGCHPQSGEHRGDYLGSIWLAQGREIFTIDERNMHYRMQSGNILRDPRGFKPGAVAAWELQSNENKSTKFSGTAADGPMPAFGIMENGENVNVKTSKTLPKFNVRRAELKA